MNPTKTKFWPYLSPILEAQKAANGVMYVEMSDANGLDRMMADSRSEDVYPGIFVFRPKYTTQLIENHLLVVNFNTQFYAWCKAGLDDRDEQDAAFDKAETILSAIIEKLQHDAREYRNYLDFNSISVEPVVYLGADAAYGYEVKMKLGLPANEIFC
ncbi:hypothetical protein [Dyadobacter sp. CY343]|uniref:hypothetical protein n=1 Tax=Dyadobacter sp. CY343 TaxID=2907299 RepID=UPI001F4080E8|nr:hypothetical protein [Dyadobacter sp. CY343]MCE7061250.1 hypothetical protein [Dyadobacter sp. CY343]